MTEHLFAIYPDDINTALGPYLTIASAAATYLTIANAASTYLTQANAATTYVPQTTTVNGHALSGNVTVTTTDLSLQNLLNIKQTVDPGGNGIVVRTASGTATARSMANAAAGITWTNADGTAGNPTPVLANSLSSLQNLSDFGPIQRIATDTLQIIHPTEPPSGRLTLTSGTPVMTADVSGATSIFWTPYLGNSISLYDGTRWVGYNFAELTLALDSNSGHTGYHQSGKNFDLFVFNNGTLSSPSLILVTGPAWSSDTARGTGAGTTQISLQNGFYVNTVSMTAKFDASASTVTVGAGLGLYVGTMRASANGQTGMIMNPAAANLGSAPFLLLFNYFNRVTIQARSIDNGAAYTYTSNVTRQAHGSSGGLQVNFVSGVPEESFSVLAYGYIVTVAIAGADGNFGPGLDTTTTVDKVYIMQTPTTTALNMEGTVSNMYSPVIGYHFVSLNEASDNAHANSFNVSSSQSIAILIRM